MGVLLAPAAATWIKHVRCACYSSVMLLAPAACWYTSDVENTVGTIGNDDKTNRNTLG